jgi:dephospho-CoA kinase
VVGLTGGIGSGKSTVAAMFTALGIHSIDADTISRRLVAAGSPALRQIASHFGEDILLQDGNLDRRKLRHAVFNDPDERQWLERLLHPLVRREITGFLQAGSDRWVLLVAPLLLENKLDRLCHRVLVVDCPEDLQLSRTIARDTTIEEDVRQIIASQMDRQARLARADDVITNDGSLEALESDVLKLKQHYDREADNSHQAG